MIKAVIRGAAAYIRDRRHDKEYKRKKWPRRLFRVRDNNFDYRTWKRGNLWSYIRKAIEHRA